MEIDLDQLRELMKALQEFEIDELELERGDEKISLKRGGAGNVVAAPYPRPMAAGPATIAAPAPGAAAAVEPEGEYITSPVVGTIYTSPKPESPAFVDAGQDFTAGQTLCIVEAMKLMNEIEAEFAGTVLEVLVENGKPVEYGDRLFRVE
ncbi:MAG: acetyl-CoA carboxylase biotin carboxyl carrier protein, partial [Myxococcota bacterium]